MQIYNLLPVFYIFRSFSFRATITENHNPSIYTAVEPSLSKYRCKHLHNYSSGNITEEGVERVQELVGQGVCCAILVVSAAIRIRSHQHDHQLNKRDASKQRTYQTACRKLTRLYQGTCVCVCGVCTHKCECLQRPRREQVLTETAFCPNLGRGRGRKG